MKDFSYPFVLELVRKIDKPIGYYPPDYQVLGYLVYEELEKRGFVKGDELSFVFNGLSVFSEELKNALDRAYIRGDIFIIKGENSRSIQKELSPNYIFSGEEKLRELLGNKGLKELKTIIKDYGEIPINEMWVYSIKTFFGG